MDPEVDLEQADVLECEERPFTNSKTGASGVARTLVYKYGGKIFKSSAEKSLDMSKVKTKVGKKATITMVMTTFGDSISPEFRVKDVS